MGLLRVTLSSGMPPQLFGLSMREPQASTRKTPDVGSASRAEAHSATCGVARPDPPAPLDALAVVARGSTVGESGVTRLQALRKSFPAIKAATRLRIRSACCTANVGSLARLITQPRCGTAFRHARAILCWVHGRPCAGRIGMGLLRGPNQHHSYNRYFLSKRRRSCSSSHTLS